MELLAKKKENLAEKYLRVLQSCTAEPDAVILLQLGRCHLGMHEPSIAEELFLEAIDADEEIIEARIELANMYEKAKENEEALILTAEAMALREAQNESAASIPSTRDNQPEELSLRGLHKRNQRARDAIRKSVLPKRYRAKRLAGPDRRKQDEKARAMNLSRQYEAVKTLKSRMVKGSRKDIQEWMEASKNLFDDFRSLKRFYSWEKYLHFLQINTRDTSQVNLQESTSELSEMYQRLSKSKT